MPSSVTSDRDYLEIVANNNTLVSATSHAGDADGVFPNTVSPTNDSVTDYAGSTTVTHSLGLVPMVRAFRDSDKNGRLYSTIRWTSGAYLADSGGATLLTLSTTTTTKLIITSGSSVADVPVYYRIYRFGTKGFTSDSSIDKIFTKGSGSKTMTAAADSDLPVTSTDTVAHGQGEKIFWSLEFSEDQTNWYKEGSLVFGAPDTASGPPGGPYARNYYFTAYGSTDATNFYITYVHNYTSQKTIYVRYVLDYIGTAV